MVRFAELSILSVETLSGKSEESEENFARRIVSPDKVSPDKVLDAAVFPPHLELFQSEQNVPSVFIGISCRINKKGRRKGSGFGEENG